jgi:hypothetical protein
MTTLGKQFTEHYARNTIIFGNQYFHAASFGAERLGLDAPSRSSIHQIDTK